MQRTADSQNGFYPHIDRPPLDVCIGSAGKTGRLCHFHLGQPHLLADGQQPVANFPCINNSNSNVNTNTNIQCARYGRAKNKWVAFVLCLLFGIVGAHKFYEGRIGMGVVYLFTIGLFGIGWLVDCITLLCKPNPYYV